MVSKKCPPKLSRTASFGRPEGQAGKEIHSKVKRKKRQVFLDQRKYIAR